MYEIKNKIFLDFTKIQKSALCNFLRALVKKYKNEDYISESVIVEKFIEDEKYYLEINSSRFEFLKDFIEDKKFIHEARLYIKECIKYYNYKKSQAPLIQAQKDFDKKKKKFLQEVKMSKEVPTKKQISYYNSLCKRFNIEKKDIGDLSKLDVKNYINEILNEHQTN